MFDFVRGYGWYMHVSLDGDILFTGKCLGYLRVNGV